MKLDLKSIKERLNAQPGQEQFDPAYMYKNPYQDVTALVATVEKLSEALKFYAKKENFLVSEMTVKNVDHQKGVITFGDTVYYGQPAVVDAGEKARAVLAEVGLEDRAKEIFDEDTRPED